MRNSTQKDRIEGKKIILHVPQGLKSGVLKNIIFHTSEGDIKEYRITRTKTGKFMMQK